MPERFDQTCDESLVGVVPHRTRKSFSKNRLHVGCCKITKAGIHHLQRSEEPGIPLRFTIQAVYQPALLVDGEVSDVAVENSSNRVPVDDFHPACFAGRCEPCRETSQLRNNPAVVTRHQGENTSDRQAVFDQSGKVSATEELRDLPVNRGCSAFGGGLEQLGAQHVAKHFLVLTGYLFQPWVFVVALGTGQCVSRAAGQELNSAKPSCRVQQNGDVNANRSRHSMFLVVLAKECPAGHGERLHPSGRPLATAYSLNKHFQHFRVCEQGFQPSLVGFANEFFRVIDFQIVAQNFDNVLFSERIEAQDRNVAVARYGFQIISVIGAEPVGLTAGKPEPRAAQSVELAAYSVQWCASIC